MEQLGNFHPKPPRQALAASEHQRSSGALARRLSALLHQSGSRQKRRLGLGFKVVCLRACVHGVSNSHNYAGSTESERICRILQNVAVQILTKSTTHLRLKICTHFLLIRKNSVTKVCFNFG